jgi:hypothetical protein
MKTTGCVAVIALCASGCFHSVKILAKPATAKITADGSFVGTGTAVVRVSENRSVAVTVCAPPEFLCSDMTVGKESPKSLSVQLPADDAFAATTSADVVNKNLTVTVKKGRSFDDAWQKIVSVVSERYDALESVDAKSGYLRTAWIEKKTTTAVIRSRFVVSVGTPDPIAFRVKLQMEVKRGQADFVPYDRAFQSDLEVLEGLRSRVEQ